ncbi:hypothetical protein MTP04_02060 [Lysinibacillus sp. PLM2]|nr:hypothetical protein MTP04_02060 [Lysinibacillus sp. PLM2]
MTTDKQVVKSLENMHIKHVRHFYRSIADINLELVKIHKSIELEIDKEKYRHATNYVNEFVSYTTVWNVKFVYNLENPEIAMLQLFHLEYILESEPTNRFSKERAIFSEQIEKFNSLNAFKPEHIQMRKQKMLDYIAEHEHPTNLPE